MVKQLRYWLLIVLLIPVGLWAANAVTFQEGKDYLTLPKPAASFVAKPGKVTVIEFFNYGCPACNHLEPTLETWLSAKPKNVYFDRVPVVFEPNWQLYAKTYYAVKSLGVAEKINPAVFDAIHKEGQDLSSEKAMAEFMSKHGVNSTDFQSLLNFSPGILAQLARSDTMMREYLMDETLIKKYRWVPQIPTIAINGRYLVSTSLVNGDNKKFIEVINYLIRKESQKA